MEQYVALLRAINVGKRRVKMDVLRTLFEDLGFEEVSTFIASGNVIFSTNTVRETLEASIERCLEDALSFDVPAMVRTPVEIEQILETNPFPAAEGEQVYVGFLKETPTDVQHDAVFELETDTDEFAFWEDTIYWRCIGPSHESKFSAKTLEKVLGFYSTFRNVTSLTRLYEKF